MSGTAPRRPGRRAGGAGPFAVIDGFAGRRSVIPFAILVMVVLGAGMVALLVLNTAIDQGVFSLQAAQQRNSKLVDQQQQLQQQIAALSAPGALASAAASQGMVPDPRPVFLNPTTGAVLGEPLRATAPPSSPSPTPTPTSSAAATGTASPTGSASPGTVVTPGVAGLQSPAAGAAATSSASPNATANAPAVAVSPSATTAAGQTQTGQTQPAPTHTAVAPDSASSALRTVLAPGAAR